jgi:hypothetical protein
MMQFMMILATSQQCPGGVTAGFRVSGKRGVAAGFIPTAVRPAEGNLPAATAHAPSERRARNGRKGVIEA